MILYSRLLLSLVGMVTFITGTSQRRLDLIRSLLAGTGMFIF
jgi:hypothetical protein